MEIQPTATPRERMNAIAANERDWLAGWVGAVGWWCRVAMSY